MTASELANRVGARKSSRGQWLALCPVHGDKKPSLSISEGRTGILLNCRSHHCDVKDICSAWGIPMKALFFGDWRRPILDTGFVKLKKLEHRLGWMIVWKAVTPRRKQYCEKAIAAIEKDIRKLEDELYPERAFRRAIQEQLALRNFDKLWEMVLPRLENVREPSR